MSKSKSHHLSYIYVENVPLDIDKSESKNDVSVYEELALVN